MTTSHAPMTHDLDTFIQTAKGAAVPDDALVALLRQNGWSDRRLYNSLTAFYEDRLGLPMPRRSGRAEYPREAFLYLLSFITLGFWAVSLANIFCTLIARTFPDAAHPVYTNSLTYEVSWQLAAVIVAFPCYVLLRRLIAGELKRRPDAFDSKPRVGLTYAALVITGLIGISDGIWFVGTFLRGELTIQFLLNTLVVVGFAGGIFTYYLTTLRQAEVDR